MMRVFRLRFTLTEIFFALTAVGTCLGWLADRNALKRQIADTKRQMAAWGAYQADSDDRVEWIEGVVSQYSNGDALSFDYLVAMLIYATGDPDLRVAAEANNALRDLSNKPQGFGALKSPLNERLKVTAGWIAWQRQKSRENALKR